MREAFFGNNAAAAERGSAALKLSKDREAEYGAALAFALAGYSPSSLQLTNDLEKRFPEGYFGSIQLPASASESARAEFQRDFGSSRTSPNRHPE